MDTRVKPAYDDLNSLPRNSLPSAHNFQPSLTVARYSAGLGGLCMDMMSMVSGILAAQAGNVQMQVAATIMKSNADAEKSAALTLLDAAQQSVSSLANLGAGIGGNLDVTV
jgi:hypothetical protein